jgi:enamidase
VLEADPHVVGHINGGTTSMSPREIGMLVERTTLALEIVHCGNPRSALLTLRLAGEAGALDRVILGNDAPSGTGVVPLGILRTLALLASVGECPPEVAVAMATGNTARVYHLPVGTIAPGQEADLVVCDAPTGSVARTALEALGAGDLPGISLVLIDGVPRLGRSRNTAPAARAAEVTRGHAPAGGH